MNVMGLLAKIVSRCKGSVSLSVNEHRDTHQSIRAYLADRDESVTPEILAEMEASDTCWRLQVYPDSPVGSLTFCGARAEDVLRNAARALGIGDGKGAV
jgi:hypothetical protein